MNNHKSDLGLIGLAVMGQNLALNFADRGQIVSVHNRTAQKMHDFLRERPHQRLIPHEELASFCSSLKRPRSILLMVKAGTIVDDWIEKLLPYLERGDIIIDGGNSLAQDTGRRAAKLKEEGIFLLGCGISGGEVGARFGPAMMLGGDREALELIQPRFAEVAAEDFLGGKCCHSFGPGGMGHLVKTVHNGIEYGDMELISEGFFILHRALGLPLDEIAEIFQRWNAGVLGGYLNEITVEILRHRSEGKPTLLQILDAASHKGTGRWTCEAALAASTPTPLIHDALSVRMLSSNVELRKELQELFATKEEPQYEKEKLLEPFRRAASDTREQLQQYLIEALEATLWGARLVSYAQGLELLRVVMKEKDVRLEGMKIARTWSGGCIIRSKLLEEIFYAYREESDLEHLLSSKRLRAPLLRCTSSWKKILQVSIDADLPITAISSAWHYLKTLTTSPLPTFMVQAQRDYFGAHTYERIDEPRGVFFHTQWNKEKMDLPQEERLREEKQGEKKAVL